MNLETLVRRVAAQVRWRRAEHYGVRGLFYGALAGALLLLLKSLLGPWTVLAAGACVLVGALAGAAWGAAQRVPLEGAARLADRASRLHHRGTPGPRWSRRPG